MYQVDGKDQVVALEDVPQSSVGAPTPLVIADEGTVVVAYYIEDRSPDWKGSSVTMADPVSTQEEIALVRFHICYDHFFGAPNDEAFAGHPLWSSGLQPYGAFRIENSSWIRQLERMNSVHRHHNPARFWKRNHYVFAFHDSTFECVSDGLEVSLAEGSIQSVIPKMVELLGWADQSK